jgi:leader peptidase (prepilin peptidase)/N-methyltransferase
MTGGMVASGLLLGAVAGVLAGVLLPLLVRWIPEPPDRDDEEPTYTQISASPSSRRRLVALAVVAMAGMGWARFGEADLPAFLVLGALGAAMVEVDLQRHRLPDRLNALALGSGLLLLGAAALVTGRPGELLGSLWGALLVTGIYAVMLVLPGGGMGRGDVKLAPAIGWHLGWLGLGVAVVGVVAGFLVGGVVAVLLLAAGRASAKTRIAYGPAILAGTWLAVLFAEPVLDWYLGR